MASLIGAHYSRNGIKQFPSRVVLSMYGNGLGGDETHPDTITILRDTRIFPSGEAPPDFHTFDPVASGISWEQYGRYWHSERTEITPPPDSDIGFPNFKTCWDALPPADYYAIINEQGGNDPWALQRAVDIERAISWAAGAGGRKCCVMNLAGGTPGDFELWKTIVAPFVVEAWDTWGHIYGRHCYADKFVDSNGNIMPGQPQRVIAELEYLQSIGYGGGVVLTECGLDGGYGVADISRFTYQVQAWEAALRPYANTLIGFCWWECGASGFQADYTEHLKTLVPYMNNSYLGRWEPAPPNEDDMEPTNCDLYLDLGRFVHLLPQDTTDDEIATIARQFNAAKNSFVYSHDDAELIVAHGRGENPDGKKVSEVRIWEPERFADDVIDYFSSRGYKYSVGYFDGSPPAEIEIIDIVDELPKHATLKYATRPLTGITTLTIHHTVSPPDRSIESIASYHVNSNGWPGIGYHFVIKDDGRIYQTNYLETKSYHAGSYTAPGDENAVSVGVTLQGDFTNDPPPQAQLDAARELVAYLKGVLPSVTAVLGHRQMPGASTACPGATWAQWLPYVAGDEIVVPEPPPPPPPVPTIDVAPYFVPAGQYGPKIVMQVNSGTQPLQLEKRANDVILRKGDGNWIDGKKWQDSEQWRVVNGQVQKGKDTSDAGNGGRDGYDLGWAQWIPQFVQVGQTYHSTPTVKRFDRTNNCQVYSTAVANDYLTIKAIIPTWVSPANSSIVLNDVLIIEWRSGTPDLSKPPNEVYYFAKGYGYVGWGNHFIVEITQGQAPLTGALDCGM